MPRSHNYLLAPSLALLSSSHGNVSVLTILVAHFMGRIDSCPYILTYMNSDATQNAIIRDTASFIYIYRMRIMHYFHTIFVYDPPPFTSSVRVKESSSSLFLYRIMFECVYFICISTYISYYAPFTKPILYAHLWSFLI